MAKICRVRPSHTCGRIRRGGGGEKKGGNALNSANGRWGRSGLVANLGCCELAASVHLKLRPWPTFLSWASEAKQSSFLQIFLNCCNATIEKRVCVWERDIGGESVCMREREGRECVYERERERERERRESVFVWESVCVFVREWVCVCVETKRI